MNSDQPRWRRYLRFWRSNVREDVDDELAFHVAERVDDLVALGMDERLARREAERRFGDIEHTKTTLRTLAEEQETGMRRSESLGAIKQDVIYALRLMRAQPSFTTAIVLTLALGIGATTSIFSVVNAVLLRPLPYEASDRIVILNERLGENRGSASAGHFHDWTEQSTVFSATAAWQQRTYNLTEGEPARFAGARVTPGFFQVQYMPPALGRYFLPTESEASRVAVLSHGLWQTRFSGDSAIVGKPITINGAPHTVVGVTPAEHTLSQFDERLWTVLSFTPEQRSNYGAHTFLVYGKLKPGATIQEAQRELERITDNIRRTHPNDMRDRGVEVVSFQEGLIGDYDTQLWVLLGAVTFVLLIGCGNVASLLLARATTRRKEIAIRGALGGDRGRLVRQLLTESIVVALIGGTLGVIVARFGVGFLVGKGPAWVPRLAEAGLQLDVLLFAAVAAITCGVLFGLAPALRATRVDLQSELREGGRGSGSVVRDRVRAALIVTEMAGALVLLVSASLFIRSAHRLQQVSLGFSPTGVTMMRVALPSDRYDSGHAIQRAFTDIVANVRAIPGVEHAGAGTRVPMWGASIDIGIRVAGKPDNPTGRMDFGHVRLVTPGYFQTIGMPLRRGRLLTDSDLLPGAPPVVIVNEAFAKTVFGSANPLGQRISGWTSGPEPEWREVIGVVADVRAFGRDQDIPPELYFPLSQAPQNWWNAFQRNMTIVAKADPGVPIAPAMRAALRRFNPQLPAFDVQTMDDVLAQSTATRRFNTMLLTLLGLTGLILAAIGIYGVIAFFVSQRTHEIGVRVALGATTKSVIGLVVRQAFVLALIGVVLGGVGAMWATRVLEDMLFEVQARDPIAFIGGAVVLLLVALGASVLPARRAARVDPVKALVG